jgi:hypothetical protein
MQLYDCKVRLNGAVANEVRKHAVTAAEIMILRALHGEDAVVEIVPVGEEVRAHLSERQRLYGVYANPNILTAEALKPRMEMLRGMFGHDTADLPQRLPGEIPNATAKPVRTKVEKPVELVD